MKFHERSSQIRGLLQLSVYGESAWEWNAQRGQYYLHQFNKSQPDLNYNNPEVVKEFGVSSSSRVRFFFSFFDSSRSQILVSSHVSSHFQDILTHWLKLGISGFRLANTRYLTEDPDLRNESRSHFPVETNNYQSLTHVYTRDRIENGAVLAKWREIVLNETDGMGYV